MKNDLLSFDRKAGVGAQAGIRISNLASFCSLCMRCFLLIVVVLSVVPANAQKKPKSKPKPSPTPEVVPEGIDVITIKTSSPENAEIPFYVRPPAGFIPGDAVHRLVVLFPFVPESGLKAIARNKNLTALADKRGWFIVSPTLNIDFKKDSRDRTKAFYYPERWSGRAVLDAVAVMEKHYPVDGHRLFIQGLSGGAQIAHRLALWCPDRVVAVVVNSSGWFDDPGPSASKMAWAITVGESDQIMPDSIAFAENLKKQGALPLLKTFIGMVHEDFPAANEICGAFLEHIDDLTKAELGAPLTPAKKSSYNDISHHPFVGDARDYWFFESQKAETIPKGKQTFLPNPEIAILWGEPRE